MEKHEDDRRVLFDWAEGDFKSAKALIIKSEEPVGNHSHDNCNEEFLLLQGEFKEMIVGETNWTDVKAPIKITVKRGVYHKFVCSVGSILLCVASEKFNSK